MTGAAADRKAVLILQARMQSTRLPGKSLFDLAGAPMVARIIERVKHCRRIDGLVLACPDTPGDEPLADLGRACGVEVFRGSEDDLVDRYYRAALATGADIVLRLPADNPVPEPSEIDRIADYHRASTNAFSSNLAQVLDNGYPDGIGCEAISLWALERLWRESTDPLVREHVTLAFYDYASGRVVAPDVFPVGTVPCPAEFRRPDIVLDVNTRDEYEFMRDLYAYLYPRNPEFHITDIIRWYDTVCTRRRGGSTSRACLPDPVLPEPAGAA